MSLKGFILNSYKNLVGGTDQDVENARNYLLERKLFEKAWGVHTIGYCNSAVDIPDSVRFFGSQYREEEKPWDLSTLQQYGGR